ncbi:glycosyl hydrolase family 18 protein [Photobacterium damselae]|uniref:glycosyl hydrolase family 18 protein n=1 Tax=Photobacterium damselae TaxID=38293 RepID=UPI00406792D9
MKKTIKFIPTLLAASIGLALPSAQAAINGQVSIVGSESQYWNTYQVTLTNQGNQAIDLRGAKIQFNSNLSISSPSWSANTVSYPTMNFTSVSQGEIFANTLALSFDQGSWVKSQLPAGETIQLTLGVSGVLDTTLVQSSMTVITEDDGNNEPSLELVLTSPTVGSEFTTGDVVTIAANVTAENTTASQVTFYVDGQEIGQKTQAPYQTLWTATDTGSHKITAKVSDANGLTAEQSAVITVKAQTTPPVEPTAPVIAITAPQQGTKVEQGETITITTQASDKDDDIRHVELWVNDAKVATNTQAPYSFSWTAEKSGIHTLTIKVIDDTQLSHSDSVTIEAVEKPVEPQAPEISLVNPRPGQTVFLGKTITISANASDANNDLVSVDFFINGQAVGSIAEAPFAVQWTPVVVGDYAIEAIAYDAAGHQTRTTKTVVKAQEMGTGNLSCDIKQIYREDGTECMGDDHPRRIIGYYTSWRTGKNGLPSYLAHDLPWDKLTHINYAFVGIDKEFNLTVDDSATKMTWDGVAGAEMDPSLPYQGHFNLLNKFKKQYPDVKTLISVGGWAETTNFYPMTTNLESCSINMDGIDKFAQSAVKFIRQYGFDGVDIDYEYPTSMKDSGNPIDFELSNKCRDQLWTNYMVMMKQLRTELDKAGKEDGRRYMLTIASPSSGYLLRGMEDFGMQDVLDYVNIMSYDLHGTWNEFVGPQAALFDDGKDAELAKWGVYTTEQYQGIGYLNQAWAHHYFRGAFKPSQINMGIPYYTRGWQGVTGGTEKGLWGKAVEPNQSTCPEGTTVCGWGAEGIDNIWHDSDKQGNEIKAGVVPMWHAMNLMHADKLGMQGSMPSYGPAWGLDPNNAKDKVEGTYERVWNHELQTAWLWNDLKKVFLSIEDKESLKPKLDYIVDNGLGGMMVWEMAGDYRFDKEKNEYVMGTEMTDYAHDVFTQAPPMEIKHNNLPAPNSVIDVTVSTTEWPAGDSNYPINPKLVFKNNSDVAIPGGTTIEFLMATATGDIVKDWSGANIKVVESGHTGHNFSVDGEKKMFHKLALTLRASESIPAGGEYVVSLVYYTPVSGVANGVRFIVGDEVIGLKKDFPSLPEFEGSIDNGNGGTTPPATGKTCAEAGVDTSGVVTYPEFPKGDHAAGGDQLIHNGALWQANWWINTAPSASDSAWKMICKL